METIALTHARTHIHTHIHKHTHTLTCNTFSEFRTSAGASNLDQDTVQEISPTKFFPVFRDVAVPVSE